MVHTRPPWRPTRRLLDESFTRYRHRARKKRARRDRGPNSHMKARGEIASEVTWHAHRTACRGVLRCERAQLACPEVTAARPGGAASRHCKAQCKSSPWLARAQALGRLHNGRNAPASGDPSCLRCHSCTPLPPHLLPCLPFLRWTAPRLGYPSRPRSIRPRSPAARRCRTLRRSSERWAKNQGPSTGRQHIRHAQLRQPRALPQRPQAGRWLQQQAVQQG